MLALLFAVVPFALAAWATIHAVVRNPAPGPSSDPRLRTTEFSGVSATGTSVFVGGEKGVELSAEADPRRIQPALWSAAALPLATVGLMHLLPQVPGWAWPVGAGLLAVASFAGTFVIGARRSRLARGGALTRELHEAADRRIVSLGLFFLAGLWALFAALMVLGVPIES